MTRSRLALTSQKKRHALLRYGVAVFSALAAIGLLTAVGSRGLGSVLFFAVLVSAWYGGVGPGLVTTGVVLGLLVSYVIHNGNPNVVTPVLGLASFTVGGVVISLLVEALHSARRRAEESTEEAHRHRETLWQSEARLEAVLENAPAVVYVKDLDGRYLITNRRFKTLFHVPDESMAGKDDFAYFPSEDAERFRENDRRVIAAGQALEFEEELTQEDGVHTYLSIKFPLFAPDGTISAVCGMSTDITDRKRLERERIDLLERERAARTEAESASSAKDQFLAVLSHELRTPLTPILASVTALLAEPGTPDETRAVLELTRWGIELETRLIDDLLDMTSILRGHLHLHREKIDAHVQIHRTLEVCRDALDTGRITVVEDFSAREHHVDADPARLKQVFWNLIKNAVKFSPQGGTLTIRTSNPRGAGPDGRTGERASDLVIEVSDTGIGIDPEVRPMIFDVFTQGEGGRVRRFGGLGLGLAICRSVVEAHGGTIEARSAGKDQGATFTVTLPTVAPPAETRPAAPQPALNPARVASGPRMLRILLVEDDAPTLRVMTRLLGKAPYLVRTANTFASALEAAVAEDFDLIISDIGLPDGSGLELMRQIRDRYAARGIALSGYGMEEDIRKSREAGFLAHLTKPVDFQKLQVAIEQVIAS